jgi:neutral ceramidase
MAGISRRNILRGGMLAATALFTTRLAGTSAARAAEAPLAVAYNELELTADLTRFPSWWMGGYGWGPRGCAHATDIGRHLKAHCMVIHDNGVPNVLLRLDIVSLPRDVHEEIRRRVVDEAKLVNAEDFMIVTSHTHHGLFIGDTHPDPVLLMGLNDADVNAINDTTFVLMDMLVDLVRMTVEETPIPATLWYDEGHEEIGANRAGLEHVMTDVPVLLARNADDGTPLAVLFGYACHPVARQRDEFIDSDYAGLAADLIAERLGIMALFFQGCAGDQNPAEGVGLAEAGERLAGTVVEVIERDQFTQVTGPFNNAMTEVDLLFTRDLTDPSEVAALAQRYEARLNNPGTEDQGKRHARLILDQIENNTLPTSIPMPIQRWRLGGLTILGLSHEVLSTYHVMLKDVAEQLGLGHLWIMAYVGETQCYVAADDKLRMGGYEAGWDDSDDIAHQRYYGVSYGWPLPLRYSEDGVDPAAPDSTEAIVMKACTELLQSS